MQFWYPEDDAPPDPGWWAPLMLFGLAMAREGLPALDPDEFMLMGRIVRSGRPDLWLYKHIYSRRYANLDDRGTPYRYIPPKDVLRSKSDGRYVLHKDPRSAWWQLDLLDFSPALRGDRSGAPCDEPPADWHDDWPADELPAA
jgi:hypothetical protein